MWPDEKERDYEGSADVQLINDASLSDLYVKACESERLRQVYDLRTTSEDGS